MQNKNTTAEDSRPRPKHIEELKDELVRLAGDEDCVYISPTAPDALVEYFLKAVIDCERKERIRRMRS